jgi:hypothetical protein
MKGMLYLTFIFSLLLSCSQSSFHSVRYPSSINKDKIGIEATLTNDFLLTNEDLLPKEMDQLIRDLALKIKELCLECTIESYQQFVGEEYSIKFPSGFKLYIGKDNRVIEVTADPIPFEKLREHMPAIDLLLEAGNKMGLNPAKVTGGGHLHFDFKAFFGNDSLLLRNYMVDSYHHSFIFNSYFGADRVNAPTIDMLPNGSRLGFEEVIASYDSGTDSTIQELVQDLLKKVYFQTVKPSFTPPEKFQAISLAHALLKNGTKEVRNIPPYQSSEQVYLIAKAILTRRDYLAKLDRPIALDITSTKKLTPKKTFQLFRTYIKEIGLSEKEYFPLLPPHVMDYITPLLSVYERKVYLRKYALFTAFNDLERINRLIKEVKKIDDQELFENILYILLEKAKGSIFQKEIINGAQNSIVNYEINLDDFLTSNSLKYSMFKKSSCRESIDILLKK